MSRITGDYYFDGILQAREMVIPASTVNNAKVAADAAIATSKLVHQHSKTLGQSGAAASVTQPIHVAGAAGTIKSFSAGSVAIAIGAATVTIDLKKNGVTCLSAVITLDTSNVAYTLEAGTITVPSVVAGEVLTVVVVATAGGGTLPTGFFAHLVIDESPVL